jgi:hypothetical protein
MRGSASAGIIELREYHGRQIACARSGLLSVGTACGTEGNYAYVFVGSVLSVTNLHGDEKRLQITPQEIFLGDPPLN